jgi:hypothetical protein
MKETYIYILEKTATWYIRREEAGNSLGRIRGNVLLKMVWWGNASAMERKLKAATPY